MTIRQSWLRRNHSIRLGFKKDRFRQGKADRKSANYENEPVEDWDPLLEESPKFDNTMQKMSRKDKNPLVEYIRSLYESVFFYGLDLSEELRDQPHKSRIERSKAFSEFKKSAFVNPFFTKSEQLALFLTQQKQKQQLKSRDKENVVTSSEVVSREKSSTSILLEKKKKLEESIAGLREELKVVEISLAACKDEGEEVIQELKLDEEKISTALNEFKVELVTVQTKLMESGG
eukprot:gene9735-10768_t